MHGPAYSRIYSIYYEELSIIDNKVAGIYIYEKCSLSCMRHGYHYSTFSSPLSTIKCVGRGEKEGQSTPGNQK